jgi:chromosome segregation ATPase
LKLAVEGRLTASETRTHQDAVTIERLCKDQDGLLQTMERLLSECNTAHKEHNMACQEHDNAQQRVGSLEAKLEREKTQKLEAKNISTGLATDLSQDMAKM